MKKIIGLATKKLTKILTNLLKRPFPRISMACDGFRGKPQILQHGMKFYMPQKTRGTDHHTAVNECSLSEVTLTFDHAFWRYGYRIWHEEMARPLIEKHRNYQRNLLLFALFFPLAPPTLWCHRHINYLSLH